MAVKFQDYYQTLGVDRSASQEEIRRAYRRMARKFHPDVNKSAGSEEEFKRIGEAYAVLRDSEKRKRYDALGENWQAGQEFSPPPGWGGFQFGFGGAGRRGAHTFQTSGDAGQFSDFFRAVFGDFAGGGFGAATEPQSPWEGFESLQTRQPQEAVGQEAEIEIGLEEAYRGAQKRFTLESLEPGVGGRMRRAGRNYDVKIPAGVTNGSRIRLAGQAPGARGQGDLYLRVRIAKHPHFEVDGRNLTQTVDISPWEAALGAEVALRTLDGSSLSVKVPAGTQSGQVLRLRGKGLPRTGGTPGDMLARVRIVVPRNLTARERELFDQLGKESKFQPRG